MSFPAGILVRLNPKLFPLGVWNDSLTWNDSAVWNDGAN
jgi:hypothetical protein